MHRKRCGCLAEEAEGLFVCTVSGMDAWLRGLRDFCTSAPLQRFPRPWPVRVNPPPRGFTVWG